MTERELEVWELAAIGMDRDEIGLALSISRGTVRKHLENLYAKVEVKREEELVILAWDSGLVEPRMR